MSKDSVLSYGVVPKYNWLVFFTSGVDETTLQKTSAPFGAESIYQRIMVCSKAVSPSPVTCLFFSPAGESALLRK